MFLSNRAKASAVALLTAGTVTAGALTFLPPCADWAIKQNGVRLELRCRSTGTIWMTIADCPAASAKRDYLGNTTIRCQNGGQTVIGPPG